MLYILSLMHDMVSLDVALVVIIFVPDVVDQ